MDSPIRHNKSLTSWEQFIELLRQELAPYPGRWSAVARMVISAVLSMIVIVTLRIPYGAAGVLCAFILSRENMLSTARSGFYFLVSFAAWIVMLPVGARMFASVPITHFLWEAVTAFLCFFFLKTFTYFPLAGGLVVVATSTMSIWYLPGPAARNVELTLWQIPSTAVGVVITLTVEVVFRYFAPKHTVVLGIIDRLQSLEDMLGFCGDGKPIPSAVAASITQWAITGTSLLCLQAAHDVPVRHERRNPIVLAELAGRCIDVAAALVSDAKISQPVTRERAEHLQARVRHIKEWLETKSLTPYVPQPGTREGTAPLFVELEMTVLLIESVLHDGPHQVPEFHLAQHLPPAMGVVVKDTFSNPDYLRFALAGTAASMLCYMVYVGLSWPGISTAVTTCALTALSDTGSSRQKQLLRIAGASIGAFVFGLGSQIFILPYIDSIVGLSILFACVTAASAYVATSSPRLSYAGMQMAFAFYLINFTDFTVPLDLTIGRDRAVGVLLGIGAMWLVFERLYRRPAAAQMVRQFVKVTRLVANVKISGMSRSESVRIYGLRDQFGGLFASVKAEGDAVTFEQGGSQSGYIAARNRIRRWLPMMQAMLLLELPLTPSPLSDQKDERYSLEQRDHGDLLDLVSTSLLNVADHLETQLTERLSTTPRAQRVGDTTSLKRLRSLASDSSNEPIVPDHLAALYKLASELESQVLSEPLFEQYAGG